MTIGDEETRRESGVVESDSEPRPSTGSDRRRLALEVVGPIAAGMGAVLLAFAGRYGYHADELYFRLLGEAGLSWGYVDQPPLLPLLARISTAVFGDTLLGLRVPAVLCAMAVVVIGAMICAEMGGNRAAQLLTAVGLASSVLVLSIGHFLLTSSVDTVTGLLVMLFMLRALLRDDGRWWLLAGGVCGVALYAKWVILLLPVTLLIGLLMVGPRSHFRDWRLYAAMGLTLVIGGPNVVYQLTNDLPQLQMARALGELDGEANRSLFVSNLIFQLGPGLVAFWVSGIIGTLRDRQWRPIKALGVAYLIATAAAFLVEGGRPDYTAGFLITLLAAGSVRIARWCKRRRWRWPFVAAVIAATAILQSLLALPVIPERRLADFPINSMALETVGWPDLADQVVDAYRSLPDADRDTVVVLVDNFGEAGALERYAASDLPAVFSGHNELHEWGPPPDTADTVLTVGVDAQRLAADFDTCQELARVDNGLEVENIEQGKVISVCRGRQAPWPEIWPRYRHLGAYL